MSRTGWASKAKALDELGHAPTVSASSWPDAARPLTSVANGRVADMPALLDVIQ